MTRAFQDQQIRQYLLGDVPASQESELEAAYFQDPDLLERMELVKDDLADDYAAGRLSAADRERFERRLLATREGREELAITTALRDAAVRPVQTPQTAWQIDRRWLSLAAVVPLALASFIAWRLISGPDAVGELPGPASASNASEGPAPNPSSPAEPLAASPQPQTPSSAAASQRAPAITLATLILTADLERSRGAAPTLLTSTGATDVELVVPRTGLKPGSARARVDSVEGAAIWSGSIVVPAADAADPLPRVRIPVSSLAPGDYFFSIPTDGDATGGPRFFFRVRSR